MISRSLAKQIQRSQPSLYYSSVRTVITSNSWAATELAAKNETLQQVKKEKFVIVTKAVLNEPSDKVKKLAEEIVRLNPLESISLWKSVQNRLGFTEEDYIGGMPGGFGGGGGGGAAAETKQEAAPEPVKEKEIFDIKIGAVDAKAKIKVIKEVRAITGLGLKEAKELVEKAPVVVKAGAKKEEVDAIKKLLVDAGAAVEVL
eukprot:gene13836-15256_t